TLQSLERRRHIGPPVAEAKVVSAESELRRREEEHSLALVELGREGVDVSVEQPRKANAAGRGPHPREPIRVTTEEPVEQRQIRINDRAGALDQPGSPAQPDQ